MVEILLSPFLHYYDLVMIELFNLHYYFSGNTGLKYLLLTFGTSLIFSILNIIIGIIGIKIGNIISLYFRITNKFLQNKTYIIPVSIILGIIYPIYCIGYGIFGGKVTKNSLGYIVFSNIGFSIIFTLLILKINSFL